MPPFNANQQQNQQQQQIQQQQIQQQNQIRQQQLQQQVLAQQHIQQQQQQLQRQRALRKARKSSSPSPPAPPSRPYQPGTQAGVPGEAERWWTQPVQYPGHAPQDATVERTGRAVTALVLGIVGMFTLITAPFAIGFGITALAGARGRQVRGKGMAVAGLVLGILGTLVLMALIVAAVVAVRRYQLSTG